MSVPQHCLIQEQGSQAGIAGVPRLLSPRQRWPAWRMAWPARAAATLGCGGWWSSLEAASSGLLQWVPGEVATLAWAAAKVASSVPHLPSGGGGSGEPAPPSPGRSGEPAPPSRGRSGAAPPAAAVRSDQGGATAQLLPQHGQPAEQFTAQTLSPVYPELLQGQQQQQQRQLPDGQEERQLQPVRAHLQQQPQIQREQTQHRTLPLQHLSPSSHPSSHPSPNPVLRTPITLLELLVSVPRHSPKSSSLPLLGCYLPPLPSPSPDPGPRHRHLTPAAGLGLPVRPPRFNTWEFRNLLWAVAKLGCKEPALFQAALPHLQQKLATGQVTPQDVSNSAWAYARAAPHPCGLLLMQAITTSGLLHAAHSTAQSLSPLPAAWPLLAYQARQTVEISGVEPRLPAQGAARLNTAKGRGRKQGRRQGQEVGDGRGAGASIGAQAASPALPPFPFSLSAYKDQELSNLVWAAATLGYADRGWRLRRAVAGQLVQRSSRLRPQALANAAWACAKLGYTDSGFYKAMLLSAGPRMGGGAQSQGQHPRCTGPVCLGPNLKTDQAPTISLTYTSTSEARQLCVHARAALPSSAVFNMLSDMLQRFPGIGSVVYQHLDADSRRAMRLVCKQLRAAIDDAVNDLEIDSIDSDDPDEVLQRLARTSLRPSKLYLGRYLETSHQPTLLAAALLAQELVPVLHEVDEGSLAACMQLTALHASWFPAMTQLTQLQQLGVVKNLTSDILPLLATLPQLTDLRLNSCPLQPSSQLSRFLFQHLTYLSVDSIHSRDLAALDCPQLQTLTLSELQVDCAGSLRACASGILEHCNAVSGLLTYNHGQEFQEAAAGAGVRQVGPPPSASVLLEALAPWQPRSGEAIEILELWHLSDVTREALEWLPVNINCLTFVLKTDRGPDQATLSTSHPPAHHPSRWPRWPTHSLSPSQLTATLSDACVALSGAAATQLPSLVARVAVLQAEAFTCPQLATLLWALSVMRVVDRQLVERVAELLLQGPLAGTGLGAGGRPGRGVGRVVQPLSAGSCRQRSASFTWVLLAWSFARTRYHHHQLYDKLGEAVQQGLQGSHLMPRLQQASSAAPPHPSSSSSSSVAATHSRSGHGTRSTSPLAGLPLSLPAPPPSPASPLPSNPLARGPPQPSPLPTPLAQLSSTCLVQLLWAFASHEHCQAALLRGAAPVLSARILQGQLSSRRVACVAWAYARLQQLEPRLVSAILRHSMAHAEQYELRYWARLAWAFSTLGLASEEAYHQRLARLMQERQQQLQRPTPAAGAGAAAQRPSRLQQRGRGHTAAPAARPGAGQGPRVGLECADEQDRMGRSRAQSQLLL
ncbi:hypothetical protein QJQ45_000254 [Haematococcus lacustris]|nr:hypothetical protein QJQ45_000254 [Haematococcus lacustris]